MPPHTSVRRGHRVPPRTRHGARGFHAPGALLRLVALASCGESRDGKADSARTAGSAVAAAPAIPSLPECPNKSGRWDECNVRQRLERAGLAPQPLPDTIRHPFLRVPGIAYRVGHAELEVFLYDSAGTRTNKAGQHGETIYVNRWFTLRNGAIASKHVFVDSDRVQQIVSSGRPEKERETGICFRLLAVLTWLERFSGSAV